MSNHEKTKSQVHKSTVPIMQHNRTDILNMIMNDTAS